MDVQFLCLATLTSNNIQRRCVLIILAKHWSL